MYIKYMLSMQSVSDVGDGRKNQCMKNVVTVLMNNDIQ